MKKIISLNGIIVVGWIAYLYFFQVDLTEWINMTFLIGLSATIMLACIKIWESQFLELFMVGFRKMGLSFTLGVKSKSLQRADEQFANDEDLIQFKLKIGRLVYFFMASLAAMSITGSLIGLIILYG